MAATDKHSPNSSAHCSLNSYTCLLALNPDNLMKWVIDSSYVIENLGQRVICNQTHLKYMPGAVILTEKLTDI